MGKGSIFDNSLIDPGGGVSGSLFPTPPKLPKPPDPLDPEEERRKARLAANRKKTLAAGAFGFSKTIQTSAVGVSTPNSFKGSKTLIGA